MEQSFLYGMGAGMSTAKTDRSADGALLAAAAKNLPAGDSEFQKLLERAQNPQDVETPKPAQSTQKPKEQPKTETRQEKPAAKGEDAPQKSEDPAQSSEILAESGAAVLTPIDLALVDTGSGVQTPAVLLGQESGEYPVVMLNGRFVQQAPQSEAQIETGVQPQAAAQPLADSELPVVEEAAAQVQTEEQPQPQIQAAQSAQPQTEEAQVPVQRMEIDEAQVQTGSRKQDSEEPVVTEAESAPQRLFRDVKAAPVKVGESYSAEQSRETADVGQQIGSQLTQALAQGESRVQIQLTPESLGSVTVEITRTQDGALHVALSAESSQTRTLLEKHAVNIQTILGRGQEDVQVEVQRQQESQQQNNNPYDGHNGNQHGRQQQEQHHRQSPQQSQDFLHQLRLGLIPAESEVS